MQEEIIIKTSDGLKLYGILVLPKEQSYIKSVILAHGFSVDNSEEGIFTELAHLLAGAGFAVFRFDFRGHGKSDGNSNAVTIVGELNDISAAVQYMKQKGALSTGLVGASFGGGVAALYTARHQSINALCLWNPYLNYDHSFLHPTTPWLGNHIERIESNLEEKQWTTIGSRNFRVEKKLFDEMADTFPYKEMVNIQVPTLILHGDNDTYVQYQDSIDYGKNLSKGEVKIKKDGEHGFQDRPDDRRWALAETLQFFKKNL